MSACHANAESSALGAMRRRVKTVQVPRRLAEHAWGGTETTILETSRSLEAGGHPTSIFTTKSLCDKAQENLGCIPVRRFNYSYPFLGLSPRDKAEMDQKGGNLLSFSLMRALLREPDVDLLHTHSGKRLGGIVRTVARIRRIPYVISLHGGIFDVPVTEQESLLEPIRGKLEWGKPFGMMLGSRRVLQDASAIVCVGRSEYEAARRLLPGQRVEYLRNGVDYARFRHGDGARFRLRHALSDDARLILCISRIDPQKGQLSLVDAMPQILSANPNAQLVLIGPVTRPAYLEQINQRIRELGLQSKILVLPGIRPGDITLIDAYHAADVFCLPSMHEPFGIVILEAWAAGCPVVATRVGGIPGFVSDGQDALLVKPDCTEELSRTLVRVLGDPGLRARLSDSGRRRAETEFDWSVVTQQLVALYQDLCSEAN